MTIALAVELLPPPGTPVVIAVSGGADSCALWDLLARDGRWPLIIWHLDHGLRAESAADAAFVRARGAAYAAAGMPARGVLVERCDVAALGGNREAAGRRERYRHLAAAARAWGAPAVLTAHHAGDQAETVLLHLLRGAGDRGLAGIPPVRPLAPGVDLVRPLLAADPAALGAHLRAHGLDWREDASNADVRLRRNRIRHAVLPELERAAPGFALALVAAAARRRDAVATAEAAARARLAADHVRLDMPADAALWRVLVDRLAVAPSRARLRRLDALAAARPGTALRLGRWLLARRRDRIEWAPVEPPPPPLAISGPGEHPCPGGTLRVAEVAAPARFDRGTAHLAGAVFPLVWRPPRPGERFRPLGAPGRQGVRTYRAEHGVPRAARDAPILADRDGPLWLPGLTIAERARATPGAPALAAVWTPATLPPAMPHPASAASSTTAVILAAGKGTRMGSDLAKVLHPLAGRPLIQHVLATCAALGVGKTVVVVGHQRERVEQAVAAWSPTCVVQDRQLGTGHAVLCARDACAGDTVLVLCGDCPLTPPALLREVLDRRAATGAPCVAVAARMPDPAGYGRMITGADGRLERIVEHKDASEAERRIDLINSGIYAFARADLFRLLAEVKPQNAQGEYYLTDVVAMLRREGRPVELVTTGDPAAVLGINTPADLARAETLVRR